MSERLRRALALLFALAVVLAACGGDDDDDSAAPGDEVEDADPNGVLRLPSTITSNGNAGSYDPIKSFSQFDFQRLVYDTFLHHDEDGGYTPGLARSWEIVDPRTLELELQPDVTFSDGTPFDGEAVKIGLMRNATSRANGFRQEVYELQDVIVEDDLHVTLKFKTPVAGSWIGLLDSGETMIPSPKAIEEANAGTRDLNTQPVGAGPFTLESYVSESKVTFRKNPNYFRADDIRLAGIEVIHASDANAVINGFQSGQFDVIAGSAVATTSVANGVEGTPGARIERKTTGNTWHHVQLCKSRPPFDDVRVRRALNFAVDREAYAELLFGREAEPNEGSWPKGHPFHNEDLEGTYDYDPDRARQLLREAGYDGTTNKLSFTAYFTPGGDGQKGMEILQTQFAAVGVEMRIEPTQALFSDFLTEAKNPAAHIGMQRQGTGKITRIYGVASATNVCDYNNPELEATMMELAAADQATPSKEAIDLWHEADSIVINEALSINIVFVPEVAIWNEETVGGVELIPNHSTGSLIVDFFDIFKKRR